MDSGSKLTSVQLLATPPLTVPSPPQLTQNSTTNTFITTSTIINNTTTTTTHASEAVVEAETEGETETEADALIAEAKTKSELNYDASAETSSIQDTSNNDTNANVETTVTNATDTQATSSSNQTANRKECGPCSSRLSCPKCKIEYKYQDLILHCSTCSRWLHAQCDELKTEEDCEEAIELGYSCILCRSKQDNIENENNNPNGASNANKPLSFFNKFNNYNHHSINCEHFDFNLYVSMNGIVVSSNDRSMKHNRLYNKFTFIQQKHHHNSLSKTHNYLLPQTELLDDNITSSNSDSYKHLQFNSNRPCSAPLLQSLQNEFDIEILKRPASAVIFTYDPSYDLRSDSFHACAPDRDKPLTNQKLKESNGKLTSAEYTIVNDIDFNDEIMPGCQMIDGVYLSELGLNFIKSQKLEPLKRQRAKRGPKLQKSDSVILDECTKDDDEESKILSDKIDEDGKRKRVRKLSKVGIGGFSVRQRGVRMNKDDSFNYKLNGDQSIDVSASITNATIQTSLINDNTSTPNSASIKPKRIRKRPKKKVNLLDQYPSYLQEAFFGKSLLDNSSNKLNEKNPDTLNDCSLSDLVNEENSSDFTKKTTGDEQSQLVKPNLPLEVPFGFNNDNDERRQLSATIPQTQTEDIMEVFSSERDPLIQTDVEDSSDSKKRAIDPVLLSNDFNLELVAQLDSKDVEDLFNDLSPQTPQKANQITKIQYDQSHMIQQSQQQQQPRAQQQQQPQTQPQTLQQQQMRPQLQPNQHQLHQQQQHPPQHQLQHIQHMQPNQHSHQQHHQLHHQQQPQQHQQNNLRTVAQMQPNHNINQHQSIHHNGMHQHCAPHTGPQPQTVIQSQMISPNMSPQVMTPMNQQQVRGQINQHVIHQSTASSMPQQQRMNTPMHPNQHLNQQGQCNQENSNVILNPSTPYMSTSVLLSPRTKMYSPACAPSTHRPPSNTGSMPSPAPHVLMTGQVGQSNMSPPLESENTIPYQMPPSPWSGTQNDLNITYNKSSEQESSWQAQTSSEDIDNMSQGKKNIQKWEADEALGEMATTSAVLYANTVHPHLKLEYKNWSERVKQIQKLWRQLPADKRKPYNDKARENRSASKSKTVKQFNDDASMKDKTMNASGLRDRSTPGSQGLDQSQLLSKQGVSNQISHSSQTVNQIENSDTIQQIEDDDDLEDLGPEFNIVEYVGFETDKTTSSVNKNLSFEKEIESFLNDPLDNKRPDIDRHDNEVLMGIHLEQSSHQTTPNQGSNAASFSDSVVQHTQQHQYQQHQSPQMQTQSQSQHSQQSQVSHTVHQNQYNPPRQNQYVSQQRPTLTPNQQQFVPNQQQHLRPQTMSQMNSPQVQAQQQNYIQPVNQNRVPVQRFVNHQNHEAVQNQPLQAQVQPHQMVNQVHTNQHQPRMQTVQQYPNHNQSQYIDSSQPSQNNAPVQHFQQSVVQQPQQVVYHGQPPAQQVIVRRPSSVHQGQQQQSQQHYAYQGQVQQSYNQQSSQQHPSMNHPMQQTQYNPQRQNQYIAQQRSSISQGQQYAPNQQATMRPQTMNQINHQQPQQIHPQQQNCFPPGTQSRIPVQRYIGPTSLEANQNQPIQTQAQPGHQLSNHQQQPRIQSAVPVQQYQNQGQYIDSNGQTMTHGNAPMQQQHFQHSMTQQQSQQQSQMMYHNQQGHNVMIRRPQAVYQGQNQQQHYSYQGQMQPSYNQGGQQIPANQQPLKMNNETMLQDKSMVVGEPITSMEFTMYESGSGRENEAVNFPPLQTVEQPQANDIVSAQAPLSNSSLQSQMNYEQYTHSTSNPNINETGENTSREVSQAQMLSDQKQEFETQTYQRTDINQRPLASNQNNFGPGSSDNLSNNNANQTSDGFSVSNSNHNNSSPHQPGGSAQNQLLKQLLGNCSSADNPPEGPKQSILIEPNKNRPQSNQTFVAKSMNSNVANISYHADTPPKLAPRTPTINVSSLSSPVRTSPIVPNQAVRNTLQPANNYEMKPYNVQQVQPMSNVVAQNIPRHPQQPVNNLPHGTIIQKRHDVQIITRNTLPQNQPGYQPLTHHHQMHPQQQQRPPLQHQSHQHIHQPSHNHIQPKNISGHHIPHQHLQSNQLQHDVYNIPHGQPQIPMLHHNHQQHPQHRPMMQHMHQPQHQHNNIQHQHMQHVIRQPLYDTQDHQQSMSVLQQRPVIPAKKPIKIHQNGMVTGQTSNFLNNPIPSPVMTTPPMPKLSISDKRKNSLAERRAALEKEPTPPPKEAKPKRRPRGPNRRSQNLLMNDIDNDGSIDSITQPVKKRARKSQIKTKESDTPQSLLTYANHPKVNTELALKVAEMKKNGLFAFGNLNFPVSRLKGSFGNGTPVSDSSLNAYKQYLNKKYAQSNENQQNDELGLLSLLRNLDRECDSPTSIVSASSVGDDEYISDENMDYEGEDSDKQTNFYTPNLNNLKSFNLDAELKSESNDLSLFKKPPDINNNKRSRSPSFPMLIKLPIIREPLSQAQEINWSNEGDKENVDSSVVAIETDDIKSPMSSVEDNGMSLNMHLKNHGNVSVTLTLTNEEVGGVKRILNSLSRLIDYPIPSTSCILHDKQSCSNIESNNLQYRTNTNLSNALKLLNSDTAMQIEDENSYSLRDLKFSEHGPLETKVLSNNDQNNDELMMKRTVKDTKPVLCIWCKAVVVDHGIWKKIDTIPDKVLQALKRSTNLIDLGDCDNELVFCSVNCYSTSMTSCDDDDDDSDYDESDSSISPEESKFDRQGRLLDDDDEDIENMIDGSRSYKSQQLAYDLIRAKQEALALEQLCNFKYKNVFFARYEDNFYEKLRLPVCAQPKPSDIRINPTGCARSEPRLRVPQKRATKVRSSGSGIKSRLQSATSTLSNDLSSPYVKQFVHSKSSQYRKMKGEWRDNVVLARSRIQGLGLYAAKDIEKHSMVIEYTGVLIRNEVAERYERIHEAQVSYLLQL